MRRSELPSGCFRFEFGSYGGPGRGYMPSILCYKQIGADSWTEHFCLVKPDAALEDEDAAAAIAEENLEAAHAIRVDGGSPQDFALSLRHEGYMSVSDFRMVRSKDKGEVQNNRLETDARKARAAQPERQVSNDDVMSLNLALTKLSSDGEIGTKIYLQLCDFKDVIRLGEKERQELFRCAMEIMRKLETVKYHRDNLIHILDDEIQKRHASMEESNVAVVDLTTGAEKEAEAFLMQGKSCLDVLVKILKPLFGIMLHSYGEAGNKVAKSLNGNLKAGELAKAQPLFELIQQDKAWIKRQFSAQRDTITHYKALPSSGFVGVPDQSGRLRYLPPVINNSISVHELVTWLYRNLLTFCEDFVALAVSLKFPPGIILGVIPEDNRDKDYPRKFGMFLAGQAEDTKT